MKKTVLVLALFAWAPIAASASTIVDQNFISFSTTIDFGANLFPTGTVVTTQFPGVTLGATYNYADVGAVSLPLTNGFVLNANSNATHDQPGSLFFSSPVTEAAFSWRTLSGDTTTFSAYLNGSLQESFSAPTTNDVLTGHYFGFTGIVFDELRFNISAPLNGFTAFTLDNLTFDSTTPLPAALPLFASGLGVLGLAGWRRKKKSAAAV